MLNDDPRFEKSHLWIYMIKLKSSFTRLLDKLKFRNIYITLTILVPFLCTAPLLSSKVQVGIIKNAALPGHSDYVYNRVFC